MLVIEILLYILPIMLDYHYQHEWLDIKYSKKGNNYLVKELNCFHER